MLVLLKRISPEALVGDIEQFIAPALIGGFLKKSGWIEKITIQMYKQNDKKKTEYYALVDIQPAAVGKRVVKNLDRKPLKGKYINVAPYQLRLMRNDRRMKMRNTTQERRGADRRRENMEIIDITNSRLSLSSMKKEVKPVKPSWTKDLTNY